MYYQIIKVGKEQIGLVWDDAGEKTQVQYIYLPDSTGSLKDRIFGDFPEVKKAAQKIPGGMDDSIAGLYIGQKVKVDPSGLNLEKLSEFSADVLRHAFRIPRGKAATYSGLASQMGHPGAARAVGTALANNPFPIIIPCHRVVRADGSPGQFGGGSLMKKQLLEKEGIILDAKGRVPSKDLV